MPPPMITKGSRLNYLNYLFVSGTPRAHARTREAVHMPSRTAVLPGQGGLFDTADVPAAPTRKHRVLSYAEPSIELPAQVWRDGKPAALTLLAADAVLEGCMPILTVDVEHNGYPVGHKHYRLKTIQLGNEHTAVVLDASCAEQRDIAAEHLNQATFLVAYSATADLVPLVHAGLITFEDAWAKMYDVMLPAKINNPNAVGTDAGLKDTAATVLKHHAVSPKAEEGRAALFAAAGWLTSVDDDTPTQRNGWHQVDPRWQRMVIYAGADVLDTAALVKAIPRLPKRTGERERGLQRMVARITHDGLPLDREHIGSMVRKHTQLRDNAAHSLAVLGVTEPNGKLAILTALEKVGIRPPLTEKGNPSLEAGVLESYAHRTGEAGALVKGLLDYRKHATLLSTFLHPYRRLCDHGDGRVRPTIYTLTARTGRMSSVRPNLQNVPRVGKLRACINADYEYLLCSADLAGIEYRLAGYISQDASLIDIAINGNSVDKTDLHWRVAQQVFGKDATKANRYTVKPGVYGRFYGGGAATLAGEMGTTIELAQAVIDGLDDITPVYRAWCERVSKRVEKGNTRYRLYTGTELQLPRAFPHKAPNYIIQRTAREILVDALLRWRETRWGKSIVLPIHDEVVAMVRAEEAHEATAALLECMTTTFVDLPITAAANEPSFAWQDAD